MEYRQLGGSGLEVPALTLGTGTFGGANEFFRGFGSVDVAQATRLVSICLESGLTMFDSADVYSAGLAEEILGRAIAGRRAGERSGAEFDEPRRDHRCGGRSRAPEAGIARWHRRRRGRSTKRGRYGHTTSTSILRTFPVRAKISAEVAASRASPSNARVAPPSSVTCTRGRAAAR